MEALIWIGLILLLIIIRIKLKAANEACGKHICPRCGSKMKMGSISGRYSCDRCGYKQGAGYL